MAPEELTDRDRGHRRAGTYRRLGVGQTAHRSADTSSWITGRSFILASVEAAPVAIAIGLAVSFIAFLSRHFLLPALRRLGGWFRRPRDCRRLLNVAWSELQTNIERMTSRVVVEK